MLPSDLLQKIRKLEIRTNRMVDEIVGGAYHSVFKGRGIEFDEVREYSEEDDVRDIDWNVTARMGAPYIKKYVEERELTVMLVVDLSASGNFGSGEKTKREFAVESAALLAFSAIGNHDKVGLILFSDEVELYLPPRSGRKHTLRLIRELLAFEPQHRKTNLDRALKETIRTLTKRSVIFVISDFIDRHYETSLRIANAKHDVIAIQISDPREKSWEFPCDAVLEDAETGQQLAFRGTPNSCRRFTTAALAANETQKKICERAGVDRIELCCGEDPVQPLIEFFRRRRKRLLRH